MSNSEFCNTKKIQEVIDYIIKYENMKYTYKNYNKYPDPNIDEEPFWIGNTTLPGFDYIYERGSVCVGLINIIRRYMNLEIPGNINNCKSP